MRGLGNDGHGVRWWQDGHGPVRQLCRGWLRPSGGRVVRVRDLRSGDQRWLIGRAAIAVGRARGRFGRVSTTRVSIAPSVDIRWVLAVIVTLLRPLGRPPTMTHPVTVPRA